MKAHLFLIQRPAGFFSLCLLLLVSMLFVWQATEHGTAAWAGSSSDEQPSEDSADRVDVHLRVVGSTTIQTIVQEVGKYFQEHTGNELTLQGGGSSFGIASVRDKTADVGMVSRSLSFEEMEEFGHAAIGHDALAVIVNSHNPRLAITRDDLRNIYTGRTTTWSNGNEDHADIVLISKRVGRGTLEIFEAYIGLLSPFHAQMPASGQDTISTSAWEAGANLDSILWVGGIRGAIGFVSIGEAQRFIRMGMPIRVLEVDNTLPTRELVAKGKYPLDRGLHLIYFRGNPQAEAFVRFMLSEPGQAAVAEQGFIPAFLPGGLQEARP